MISLFKKIFVNNWKLPTCVESLPHITKDLGSNFSMGMDVSIYHAQGNQEGDEPLLKNPECVM